MRGMVALALVIGLGATTGCGPERLKLAELYPSATIRVTNSGGAWNDETRYRRVDVTLGASTSASIRQCQATRRLEVSINGRAMAPASYGEITSHHGLAYCSGARFSLEQEPYDIVDVRAFEEDGVVDLVEIADGETTWDMGVVGLMSPRTVKGLGGSEDPVVLEAGAEATLRWSRSSDLLERAKFQIRGATREEETGVLIDFLLWQGDEIRVQGGAFVFSVPQFQPARGLITISQYGLNLHPEVRFCDGLADCQAVFEFDDLRFPIEIR